MCELLELGRNGSSVVVCGDFNQPKINWIFDDDGSLIHSGGTQLPAASVALIDGMDALNLLQYNSHRNHLNRILDLVFCSPGCLKEIHVCVAPLVPCDEHHPALVAFINNTTNRSFVNCAQSNARLLILDYRRINIHNFTMFISTIDWSNALNSQDVNIMAKQFCMILGRWFNENLPLVRKRRSPVWSNSALRTLKRDKNAWLRKLRRHRTTEAKRKFKRSSEAYRALNASLYKSYVLRIQTNLRTRPKSFWNFIKSKRETSSLPSNMFLKDRLSDSSADHCQLFAEFFASVFADKIASVRQAVNATDSLPANVFNVNTFEIVPDMIIAACKKIKNSHDPGPDGIPAVVLRQCSAAIAVPLCLIFNKSFEQKTFPDVWKQSIMFPVFKKGDRHNIVNYRGITNLSAISKLFEIIVSKLVLSSVKHYISQDQHGFMPGRSTTTNLMELTSTCFSCVENKAQVDVIYTDIKAAFDSVDHNILLYKFSRLGASDNFIVWLKSYLTDRVVRVKIDKHLSHPFTNLSGVPQGSNLGPLLFLVYINDAITVLDRGCRLAYADDLKIYRPVYLIEDCHHLQTLLDTFARWCEINLLTISIHKCAVISFHRTQSPIIYNYSIDNVVLERVNEINDLGVMLECKLNFTSHWANIITKATRQLGFIYRVTRDFSDPYCHKALYCALVRPIIENTSIIWNPHFAVWDLRIERIQRRFIRQALKHLPWRNPMQLPPYPDRCRLLGLDTLQRRRRIQQAVFIAKVLNSELDVPSILARLNIRVPPRALRASNLLQTNFHRTAFGNTEPLSACIRTFSTVDNLFCFEESSHKFKRKLTGLPDI